MSSVAAVALTDALAPPGSPPVPLASFRPAVFVLLRHYA
jgi:hypothetical protein